MNPVMKKKTAHAIGVVLVIGMFTALGMDFYGDLQDRWAAQEAARAEEEAKAEAERKVREAEALAEAERIEARKKADGTHCFAIVSFTDWSTTHPQVQEHVIQQLRDPESFEHVETQLTKVREDQTYTVQMTFRARNGFGGMTEGHAVAEVDNETCEASNITIVE